MSREVAREVPTHLRARVPESSSAVERSAVGATEQLRLPVSPRVAQGHRWSGSAGPAIGRVSVSLRRELAWLGFIMRTTCRSVALQCHDGSSVPSRCYWFGPS
jgi:hypothetical protein